MDNWPDGNNRPSHAYVSALARESAPPGSGPDIGEFERELRRQLTLARLAALLAALTGRDAVIQLTSTAVRLARTLSASIGFPLSREDHAGSVELRLLLFGTLEDSAPVLLWWLAKLESDPEWTEALLAAGEPWQFHFEHMAAMHSRSSAASWATLRSGRPGERVRIPPAERTGLEHDKLDDSFHQLWSRW